MELTEKNFARIYLEEIEARVRMLEVHSIPVHFHPFILASTFQNMSVCLVDKHEWVGARGGLQWSARNGWE